MCRPSKLATGGPAGPADCLDDNSLVVSPKKSKERRRRRKKKEKEKEKEKKKKKKNNLKI